MVQSYLSSFVGFFFLNLSKLSEDLPNRLYYFLPLVAMGLIALYCLFGQKRLIGLGGKVGEAIAGFARGLLLAALLVAALLAVGNYNNFGRFRYGSHLNAYEFYHYYMGSKYAREIGYTDLYNASLVADFETGMKYSGKQKKIRNLDIIQRPELGRYRTVQGVLDETDRIKGRFSDARWEEWVKDIRWFKSKLVTSRWNGILRDKGYNASPVWSMLVGGFLSNQVSTDNETGMLVLSLLDVILIAVTFGCVVWAFGPRAALFMIVLLGTQYMMKYSHMKGAYLRTDFAMCLVMAACLIKKDRYKTAGALTGYAILSRVFPAVFLFGLGAKLFWELVKMAAKALDALMGRSAVGRARWRFLALLLLPHLLAGAVVTWALYLVPDHYLSVFPLGWPPPWYAYVFLVFPLASVGLFLASCGLWGLWRRVMDVRQIQFLLSACATVAILVGASVGYWNGLDLWKDYAEKIGYHNNDISPWRVGFKYIFITRFPKEFELGGAAKKLVKHTAPVVFGSEEAVGPETPFAQLKRQSPRPAATYKTLLKEWAPYTRSVLYKENPKTWWAIQAAMLLFCLFAVRGLKDHMAFVFGFVPCFFLVAPTYYYYVMLAVPLLFFTVEMERPTRALGAVWLFLTAMAGYYFNSMWVQKFPTYFWLAFMLLLLVFYMMALAFREGRTRLQQCIGMAALVSAACFFFSVFPQQEPSAHLLGGLNIALVALGVVLTAAELAGLWRRPFEPAPLGPRSDVSEEEAPYSEPGLEAGVSGGREKEDGGVAPGPEDRSPIDPL